MCSHPVILDNNTVRKLGKLVEKLKNGDRGEVQNAIMIVNGMSKGGGNCTASQRPNEVLLIRKVFESGRGWQ